jgi:RimJ/RimL family protein N-acetyltransferase
VSSSEFVVETQRLRLRPFEEADAAHIGFYCDPDVMRFIPGGPRDPALVEQRFLAGLPQRTADWAARGHGAWAVVRKETGELIGHCGLAPLPDGSDVELYYLIDKPHWRQGYATEAARAALRFGFTRAGLSRIVAIALTANAGSLRVMAAAGMRLVGPARHYDADVVLYVAEAERDGAKGGDERTSMEEPRMSKILLISQRPAVLSTLRAENPEGVAIAHVEALARIFADAHANKYVFSEIYADFRDTDRGLIRALFQTAGFNREQVAGSVLHMDIEPGAPAEQQKKFFTGLGMDCRILA